MLQAGHTTNVSFKVNVMGTSTDPKVRLILGTTPELSFAASKGEGDTWGAEVLVPKFIDAGSYDFRVEVVLNNRLFTPLNKKIEIASGVQPEVQMAVQPEVEAPAEPAVQTVPEPEVQMAVQPEVEVPRSSFSTPLMTVITAQDEKVQKPTAPEMPRVQAKMPKIVPKVEAPAQESITTILPPAPQLSLLKNVAEKPAKRVYERIKTAMPKPGSVKIEPIRIHISEIDSVTTKVASHVVEAVKAAKVPMKPLKSKSVVRLVKEDLFYA